MTCDDVSTSFPIRKDTLKLLVTLCVRELYPFLQCVDEHREFCLERAKKYAKIVKTTKIRLWSEETEEKKSKEDTQWIRTYDITFGTPKYWYDAWRKRKFYMSNKLAFETKYNLETDLISGKLAYVDDIESDNGNFGSDGESEENESLDTIVNSFSPEEFFLRCIEMDVKRYTVAKLVTKVGKQLLNDERILERLHARGNVTERLENLIIYGVIRKPVSINTMKQGGFVASSSKKDKILEKSIKAEDLQNLFYLLGRTRKKISSLTVEGASLKRNPDAEFTPIHGFKNGGFSPKLGTFVSAFCDLVIKYSAYRTRKKMNAAFFKKPGNDNDYAIYDLKHNVVFEDVSFFFKYNVYSFPSSSIDTFKSNGFNIYETPQTMMNDIVELGFKTIEPKVLITLVYKSLIDVKDPYFNSSLGMILNANIRAAQVGKYEPRVDTSDYTIDHFPAYVRTDTDLLKQDEKRLSLMKKVFVTEKNKEESSFEIAVRRALRVFVRKFQSDEINCPDFEKNPEKVAYYYTKHGLADELRRKYHDCLGYDEETIYNAIANDDSVKMMELKFVLNDCMAYGLERTEVEEEIRRMRDRKKKLTEMLESISSSSSRLSSPLGVQEIKKRLKEEEDVPSDLRSDLKRLSSKLSVNDFCARGAFVSVEEEEKGRDGELHDTEAVSTDLSSSSLSSLSRSDDENEDENNENTVTSTFEEARIGLLKTTKKTADTRICMTNVHKDSLLFVSGYYVCNV